MAPALTPSGAAEAVGRAYDAVPYDAPASPALDPAVLRGAAAALGIRPAATPAPDMLDIGCGTGNQLLRAASQSAGRMLGIDASQSAVALANSRGAVLGPRFQVLHADATGGEAGTLDVAKLGSFDVITIIGTLFIMPPELRARTLHLAGTCLRPGGVLAISGYTGLVAQVRSRINAVLRGENDPSLPHAAQIARARANITALDAALPPNGPATPMLRQVFQALGAVSDSNVFHEALGTVLDPLDASSLATALAPHGIAFLNSLPPLSTPLGAGSAKAAQSFDVHDLIGGGGYRTLLFARKLPDAPPCGPRDPALDWHATLRAVGIRDGKSTYLGPNDAIGIATVSAFARGVLDSIATSQAAWPALLAAGMAARDPSETSKQGGFEPELDDILGTLWSRGLATPRWRGA